MKKFVDFIDFFVSSVIQCEIILIEIWRIFLVGGDHGSKYRVDVNVPGRQENPVFRSANIIVAPFTSCAESRFPVSELWVILG